MFNLWPFKHIICLSNWRALKGNKYFVCSSNYHNWKHMSAAFTTVCTKCTDANRPFRESRKHWWLLLWKWQQVPLLLLWILVVGLKSPALGSRLVPLKTALKYQSACSTAQSSHSSLCKQGQEHGHAYTSLSVILFLCPVRHLLTHDCLSSTTPPHPHHYHHPPLISTRAKLHTNTAGCQL